ncbi:hypothetical protein Pyn_02660 [Prunus yedoensis var. nudiflora]|uniref:Uncharacterized protein n=1 Tax=Prunus yedoensis var. nudiflora TaxID=2094558 RepID=A0A314ZGT7_PRUYE|nr:hypothetical protein Pyn_02660 [Prunus yedoensis var. nudiflora]
MGLMSTYYHPYHNSLKQAPGILRGVGPLKLVAWRVAYLLGVACVQAHMTNFRVPKSEEVGWLKNGWFDLICWAKNQKKAGSWDGVG